jgi:hypothetical protein
MPKYLMLGIIFRALMHDSNIGPLQDNDHDAVEMTEASQKRTQIL